MVTGERRHLYGEVGGAADQPVPLQVEAPHLATWREVIANHDRTWEIMT